MELIRNCVHHSSTYVFLKRNEYSIPEKIIKTSLTRDGYVDILREYQGLCWYCSQLSKDPDEVVVLKQNNNYSIIEIKFFPGDVGLYNTSLSNNYNKIYNAIIYYLDIFRNKNNHWSHGDYSINNIVFENDQIKWLIDWESFNEKLPLWFDCLNCILEAVYFRYKKAHKLSDSDLICAKNLLSLLSVFFPIKEIFSEKPASIFRRYYGVYKADVFFNQIDKYPFINAKDEDISKLDNLLQGLFD